MRQELVERKVPEGIEHKQFAIEDFKVVKTDEGVITVEGYANTKNKADRYGDIPTVFPALRDFVYGLDEFIKNPVCLLDHDNSIGNVVGSFNPKMGGYILEDEVGLRFKLVFSNSDYPMVAHARTVYQEGHARALSIGGNWFFEDKDNPKHLTFAKIYEISLVGVGADPDALTKKGAAGLPHEAEKGTARNLQEAITLIEESIKAGQVLSEADREILREAARSVDEQIVSIKKQEEKICQIQR